MGQASIIKLNGSQTAVISGTVVDKANQVAIPAATITLYKAAASPDTTISEYGNTETKAGGSFSFDELPAGKYFIRLNFQSGYPNQFWGGTLTVEKSTPIDLNQDESKVIKIEVEPESILQVSVLDEATQEVVDFYSSLYLFDADGNNVMQVTSGFSEYFIPNGTLEIGGLLSGTYYPWIFPPGGDYTAGYTTVNLHDPTQVASITVAEGDTQPLQLEIYVGGTITGTIFGVDNLLTFRYGDVNLYQTDDDGVNHWLKSTAINSKGEYRFQALNPDYTYTIEVIPDVSEFFAEQYGPRTTSGIKVDKGETTVVDFRLAEGSQITGKIVSSEGQTAIETQVNFYKFNDQPNVAAPFDFISSTTSDEDGAYQSPILGQGVYYVEVAGTETHHGEYYSDGALFSGITNGTPIQISADENLIIDFEIESISAPGRTGRIEGFIYDVVNEEGQGDALVRVYQKFNDEFVQVREEPADQSEETNGQFVIDGLADGEYFLEVVDYGSQTTWYGGTQFAKDSQPVRIEAGQTVTDIDFALEKGGRISGKIVQPAVQSVPFGQSYYPFNRIGLFNSDGELLRDNYQSPLLYSFQGLWPGEYYVAFYDYHYTVEGGEISQMYHGEWYSGSPNIDGATPLIITGSTRYDNVDGYVNNDNPPLVFPSLEPTNYILSGRVVDESSNPIEGVMVTAESGRGVSNTTITDANGEYSLNLIDGTYTITFAKEGYDFSGSDLAVTIDGSDQTVEQVVAPEEVVVTPTPTPEPPAEEKAAIYLPLLTK